jgi:hypothetical protein
MCACTGTDMRESVTDCILASGEGYSSRGETFHPLYAACPASSSAERTVYNHSILIIQLYCDITILNSVHQIWCKFEIS